MNHETYRLLRSKSNVVNMTNYNAGFISHEHLMRLVNQEDRVMQSDTTIESTASVLDRIHYSIESPFIPANRSDKDLLVEAANEIQRLQTLRMEMLGALLEVSFVAQEKIDTVCASIEECGLNAEVKLELAKWQGVLTVIDKASAHE